MFKLNNLVWRVDDSGVGVAVLVVSGVRPAHEIHMNVFARLIEDAGIGMAGVDPSSGDLAILFLRDKGGAEASCYNAARTLDAFLSKHNVIDVGDEEQFASLLASVPPGEAESVLAALTPLAFSSAISASLFGMAGEVGAEIASILAMVTEAIPPSAMAEIMRKIASGEAGAPTYDNAPVTPSLAAPPPLSINAATDELPDMTDEEWAEFSALLWGDEDGSSEAQS